MKAVVYRAPGKVEVAEVPKPRIEQSTDAVLRVTTASICGSDLHIYHGLLGDMEGMIVGHEFVGIIDELGDGVQDFQVGQRVWVEAGLLCGACDNCKNMRPPCLHGGIFGTRTPIGALQGGQAEYVRVPFAQRIMHKVPEHLTDEDVIFLTDSLMTGYTAAQRGEIHPGDTVAVFGCGTVGLCAQACARMFGPSRVYAIDLVPYRLELARKIGCIPIDASQEDPVARLRAETDLLGIDVALETVGARPALEAAFASVRPLGRVSVVGVFTEPVTLPMPLFSIFNVTIRTGLADPQNLPRLTAIVESGALDLKFLISHTLPLAEAPRAYELFDRKEDNALKILLKP
jgi:alcohol dehydrogenase